MTPEMSKWIRQLGDKAEDYLEHKWFDITGVDTSADTDDLSAEYIQLLQTYKLPFDKTVLVCKAIKNRLSLLMSLEGDYMEGGLRIYGVFKSSSSNELMPIGEAILKPGGSVDGAQQSYTVYYGDETAPTQEASIIVPVLASATAMFYKTLAQQVTVCAQPTPINSFTNRRLKAQGKPLQYEWKTIEIGIVKPRKAHQGGTHAPPRLHERRGHLRNLKSGKQVWIKSCKVGDASRGTVFHDYTVAGKTKYKLQAVC